MIVKSVEAKGRNIQEATENALKELQVGLDFVTIEVIEEAEDRLFGLLVKPAIVRATLKSPTVEEDVLSSEESSEGQPVEAGTIQIVNMEVRHAATDEDRPVLIPSEELIVKVNGNEISEATEINRDDIVEIQSKVITKENGFFEIILDKEKLEATLQLMPGYIEKSLAMDDRASTMLELRSKTVKKPYQSFSEQDIFNELKKRNITYGVDEQQVKEALKRHETCEVVIAKGKPPVPGQHGYVEFFVQHEISESKPKVLEDGTVDFREIRTIPVVEAGQTIGHIQAPVEGEQGTTVDNQPIQPNPVIEVTVKGKGITREEDKLLAVETGTIRVIDRSPIVQIDIIEKLVHTGDVDIKSGNLSFVGDIEISGNVEETMSVETDERILVLQSLHGATVGAGTELVVKQNVIRSNVTVGKVNENELNIREKTGELLSAIKRFHQSLLQLTIANRRSGQTGSDIATVVRVLLNQKFPTLQSQVKEYFALMHDKGENDVLNINEIVQLLYGTFVMVDGRVLKDEMVFVLIEDKLDTLHRYYERRLEPIGRATLGSVQQSEVFCNGDIYLTGRGAYNSTFHAEGTFVTNGFVRGGSIYAKKGIKLNEVGSGFGVETMLIVPKGEKIIINHAKEDTVLQIGKRIYRFVKERSHITAQLDETGAIVLA